MQFCYKNAKAAVHISQKSQFELDNLNIVYFYQL